MTPSPRQPDRPVDLATSEPLYERPADVAVRFGISRTSVYKAIYAGELPAIRFRSRTVLIRVGEAETWFASQLTAA